MLWCRTVHPGITAHPFWMTMYSTESPDEGVEKLMPDTGMPMLQRSAAR
jgi:hypothetical protein